MGCERPRSLPRPGAFACLQVTSAASLAFLMYVGGRGVAPPALRWEAIGPETTLDSAPGPVRLRPRGKGTVPGVVARSDVDTRLAAVEVCPGGVAPAGQGDGDQRAD